MNGLRPKVGAGWRSQCHDEVLVELARQVILNGNVDGRRQIARRDGHRIGIDRKVASVSRSADVQRHDNIENSGAIQFNGDLRGADFFANRLCCGGETNQRYIDVLDCDGVNGFSAQVRVGRRAQRDHNRFVALVLVVLEKVDVHGD